MVIKNLCAKLDALGIVSGDTICVSSDVGCLGVPLDLIQFLRAHGIGYLLESYVETLRSVIGNAGTILMPTFTYSACNGEVFDPLLTPSKVGALTEYFRKMDGVRRTNHPIFSYAVEGPKAGAVLQTSALDAFGPETVFDYMCKQNGKYVLLGLSLSKGATNTYYSEQKFGVPYRHHKVFNASILANGTLNEFQTNYFVRDLNIKYVDAWADLQRDAIAAGVVLVAQLDGKPLLSYKAQDMHEFIESRLRGNSEYLIRYVLT